MKILFISSSILPYTGGSSVIMENLSQNFLKDELIIIGSRGWEIPKIVRANNSPVFRYFFSELSLFGRGARFFNWFRKWRLNPLIKYISQTIERENITHVIGVYPNSFYCLAAARAAKKNSIPFSSYFHNTYLENTAINEPNAAKWQKEIFDASDHIFVMSEGMKLFYKEKYSGNKFISLVHTFNDFPDQKSMTGVPGIEKETYKLVAFGNFNESNLEATKRFLQAIKGNPKFTISIYTHVPKILLQNRGLDTSLFSYMGSVKPEEIHDTLQKYDICILTHGFKGGYGEIEYRTIFPTRTIPMLLSGKPILAHSPNESFLNAFVKSHQCAELVDNPTEEAILNGLEKIIKDESYQRTLVANAAKTSELFHGEKVVKRLKEMLG